MTRDLRRAFCTALLASGFLSVAAVGSASAAPTTSSAPTSTSATSTPTQIPLIAPTLNTPIPGIEFRNYATINNQQIEIPFLAQYIAGIYRYLLSIAVIAAAVMVVYGGFKYILAANFQAVKDGKETIKDALIGLVVILAAYTIMASLTPDALNLTGVKLAYVKKEEWGGGHNPPGESPPGDFPVMTPEDVKPMAPPYTALTIKKECKRDARITPEYVDQALEAQHQTGVPAAFLIAQWATESGFGAKCIGPPGKKFNCFGYKCYDSNSEPKYQGNETPVSNPAPTCPASCFIAQTPEPKRVNGKVPNWKDLETNWACFLTYDNIFSDQAKRGPLHRKGWEQYNGSPQSYAKFVAAGRYAGPDYGDYLVRIMKDQCLL